MAKHVISIVGPVVVSVLVSASIFAYVGHLEAQQRTVSRCKTIEFKVTGDSTYYEVQCGGKAKIKTIIESD